MIPHAYRVLLVDRRARRLLAGLGVSSLGDGMSTVTIAWLAVRTAPAGKLGLFVGLAVAAYTLPGAAGALTFGRCLRRRAARTLVLAHCLLRAGFLGTVVALAATGALSPAAYVVLLAGSSLLASWGSAGQYTLLAEVGGVEGCLAANSLASAQVSLATILGPAMAGLLLAKVAPCWLLAFDAASFAFLGGQVWCMSTDSRSREQPIGAYWTNFGVGAFASTLLTGTLRGRGTRRVALLIVAGWGACLVPFAFAPVGLTLVCFAAGGVVYGPFVPLSYALFQSITTTANLPSVLAARSAALIVAAPLGTGIGGPIVAGIGAGWTLTASGAATILLAGLATSAWRPTHKRTLAPSPI